MKLTFVLSATAAALLSHHALAQVMDAPPMDPRQLLEALKQLREQNESGIKNRRASAYQQVVSAAGSPERAVAFWKEAVKAVQFEGAAKEGSKIADWRDGDGEALSDRLCANAVRLHLNWLAINLQHTAGAETKALLPKVVEHVHSVQAALLAAEQFAENLDKAKERGPSSPGAKRSVNEDGIVKRVHDQLMRTPIGSSPVARWLQIGDLLGERKGKGNGGGGGWEQVAGNVDGIYNSVILPEYRASKDPRLLEYWDMVLKRETDRAAQRKLDVEQRDWTQVKRPSILWNRAQDVLLLGQKNRALGEMFNLIKTFPQHPDAGNWLTHLEGLVAPQPAAAAPAPAANPTGAVTPPAAVPSATGAAAATTAGGLLVK